MRRTIRSPATARGQIYETNYGNGIAGEGTVGEYSPSGATVSAPLISGLDLSYGVLVYGGDLFVANYGGGTIGEYTTSGTTINPTLISGLGGPLGIALLGSDILVLNRDAGTIGEYTVSGATVNAKLVSGLNFPYGIVVSGSDLFVTNSGANTIGEYTTSGATINSALISGLRTPYGIAISGSDLFVANYNGGTTVNPALISGLQAASGVAISGSDLFESNSILNGTIGEYTTSGTPIAPSLVTGLDEPDALALPESQAWTGGGTDANWTTADNWGGIAISPNVPLVFAGEIQLTNENNFAAGTQFDGITFSAGAGAFTLAGNAINLAGDIVNNSTNLQTINLNLALQQNTNLVTASGDLAIGGNISGQFGITLPGMGTVTLSGSNSYTGGTTVNAGKLLVATADAMSAAGGLTIGNAAAVQLQSGIGTVSIQSLTINSGGALDLDNSPLIINYGAGEDPITSIIQYVRSGYNAGFWNGAGIFSSSVASLNASQSHLVYAIGYSDGGDGIVNGLSSGQIEIMPTLAGDAKLQGNVVFGDFQLLSQYFGQSGTWDEGNFTYGPTINFGDFQLLSQDFAASPSGLTVGELASINGFAAQFDEELVPDSGGGFSMESVPEPSSAAILAIGMGLLTRRRKRMARISQ
jgi:autotransporter-associated beta strand protein